MNAKRFRLSFFALLAGCLFAFLVPLLGAKGKDKEPPVDPNDPTLRLFQAADTLKGGKISDLYLIADLYRDPALPKEESQHILKIEYDKTKVFGKLQIYVRSVGKIHPDQMKAYSPQQFFEFGLNDQAKFIKSVPGPLGRPGDMYLHSSPDRPLASVPITDEIRSRYEMFVTKYILPAIEKK